MKRLLAVAGLLLALLPGRAWAVNCNPLPYVFAPGTTASATEVNANFAALLTCMNFSVVSGPGAAVVGGVPVWQDSIASKLQDSGSIERAYLASQLTATRAAPTGGWPSFTGDYGFWEFNANAYPATSRFGDNATPIPEALVGMLNIPANSAGVNHGSGVAGYARTSSTTVGAVGSFGFGGVTGAGMSAWGANFLVTNAPKPQASVEGFDNSVIWGVEIDVNLTKTAANAAPLVAVRGLSIIGGGETEPLAGSPVFAAIDIDSPGIGLTPKSRWYNAIQTEDGSAQVGLYLGTVIEGNNAGSQPIRLRSKSSGGVVKEATVITDADGNLDLVSGNASFVSMCVGSPSNCGFTLRTDNTAQITGGALYLTNTASSGAGINWNAGAKFFNVADGGVTLGAFGESANSVNFLQWITAATGVAPLMQASGTDSVIGVGIAAKGAGDITLQSNVLMTGLSTVAAGTGKYFLCIDGVTNQVFRGSGVSCN